MKQKILASNLSGLQSGATMIEVLVAVVVISVGLLGIASMQLVALRNSQGALQDSMATMYSYSMLDSMRANADVAKANGYDGEHCNVPAAADSLVRNDIASWVQTIDKQLGETTCGEIDCDGKGQCEIELSWFDSGDRRAQDKRTVTTKATL